MPSRETDRMRETRRSLAVIAPVLLIYAKCRKTFSHNWNPDDAPNRLRHIEFRHVHCSLILGGERRLTKESRPFYRLALRLWILVRNSSPIISSSTVPASCRSGHIGRFATWSDVICAPAIVTSIAWSQPRERSAVRENMRLSTASVLIMARKMS